MSIHVHRVAVAGLAVGLAGLCACSKPSSTLAPRPVNFGGGHATSGAGGTGGFLLVEAIGAPIELVRTGALPDVPAPAAVTRALGANPLTVATSGGLTAVAGVLTGDDGVNPATGLWVKAGATLTLNPDSDGDAILGNDLSTVTFTSAVWVEGTLTTGPRTGAGPVRSNLTLTADQLVVGAGGVILLSGPDATAATPGSGGAGFTATVGRDFVCDGRIDARGGAGQAGGAGGSIQVSVTSGQLVIRGVIDSSGGAGLAGPGGPAGRSEVIGLTSSVGTGSLWLTGSCLSRGGSGTLGGGAGGMAVATSCQVGAGYLTGLLDASGGDATGDGPGGPGGFAGVESSAGPVVAGGSLTVRGGRGGGGGGGGAGGQLFAVALANTTAKPDASTRVSLVAELDASGGDAAAGGGPGGTIEIAADTSEPSQPRGVLLVLPDGADLTGGPGGAAGGAGGNFVAVSALATSPATTTIGSVTVAVPVDARGGVASAGQGGAGGTVDVHAGDTGTPASNDVPDLSRALTLTAAITVAGGGGTTGGGPGGSIMLYERLRLTATAGLDASGGPATTGPGGLAGHITATSAALTVGPATADGGASAAATGGNGGVVTFAGTPTQVAGPVSLRSGAGSPAGAPGVLTLDGATPPLTGGVYRP